VSRSGLKKGDVWTTPFFAITTSLVTPGREFVIRQPDSGLSTPSTNICCAAIQRCASEHAPVLEGHLAFNILTSVAMQGQAFAQNGPE
jgi:hypothetical protein